MKNKFLSIIRLLLTEFWTPLPQSVSHITSFFFNGLKKIVLAVRFFIEEDLSNYVSALTYSTLLAIVPIMAVVFGIARGFGFNVYIEQWFMEALSSQPKAAEVIVSFVNSYLVHTRSGVILGVGLIFMLWTVIRLIRNIEQAFNHIWQVRQQRSWQRMFTDYFSMFFLLPIILVLTSGISIFISTIAKNTEGYIVLGSAVKFLISLMPYVLMSLAFMGLYLFMPNTKVRFKHVIIPGIIAGVAMQILQLIYIHSQLFLSGYNAIYGSFAALPLFMLWVQFSWSICLFGAELSYTSQNLERYAFLAKTEDLSHLHHLELCAILLNRVCKRFVEGKHPLTALELKMETNIPIRITTDLLHIMERTGLLVMSYSENRDSEPTFLPAMDVDAITMGEMIDRLEKQGKWTLDLDLQHMTNSDSWQQIFEKRKTYISNCRNILVVDLE